MVSERGSEVALLWRMYVLFLYACEYINIDCTSKALAISIFKKKDRHCPFDTYFKEWSKL